jgi:hypothetical protein
MADDDRIDARDDDVATWLAVEPLDEVTRRRLVAGALREAPAAPRPERQPSRAWRWIAAAAAVVVLGVGALAVVTAEGGHDERVASRAPRSDRTALAPAAGVVDVGDVGDLAVAANVARVRDAAGRSAAAAEAPAGAATQQSNRDSAAASACDGSLPAGTVLVRGTGTFGGHDAVVVLLERPDGPREVDALLTGSCELRRLS